MGMKATAAEYKSRLFSLVFPVAQTFYLLPLQHALWSWLIEQSGTKEKLLSTLAVTNPLVWSLGKLKKKKKKKKSCFALSPHRETRRWSVCQEIKVSKMWSCRGWGECLPPASGQAAMGECVGVNVGSGLSAVAQLYRPSGTADMRRAATSAMTWWGTQGLFCHTTAIFIQHSLAYKLCACV